MDLGARRRFSQGARRAFAFDAFSHADGRSVSLTAQQPLNNIVRTTTEALSAVLGGTQSLRNSYDEALALPTEDAVRVALKDPADHRPRDRGREHDRPLGGSCAGRRLTDRLEVGAYDYFRRIDELGGMVAAIKQTFPQREIADASFRLKQRSSAESA